MSSTAQHTATAPSTAKRKTAYPSIAWALAVFNLPLSHARLPLWREAVLTCIDSTAELETWSNESRDRDGKTKHLAAFPLIHFRVHRGHAAIYALQAGVPLLLKFVQLYTQGRQPLPFAWNRRPMGLQTLELISEKGFTLKSFAPKLRTMPVVYRLHSWLPLNKENYGWWKANRNLPDAKKTQKLGEILVNHICTFITATGGYIPKARIKLCILDKDRLKKVFFKDTGQVAFDVRYTVNLELPPFMGLGNHPAFGFGWQRPEEG